MRTEVRIQARFSGCIGRLGMCGDQVDLLQKRYGVSAKISMGRN
jgi:hypothetical protein